MLNAKKEKNILVFSDSHGDISRMKDVLEKMGSRFDALIHLGDMADDIEKLRELWPGECFYVRGNNEFRSDVPTERVAEFSGAKLFMTHGHLHRVYFGADRLYYAALEKEANVALFGHTHIPCCEYSDGMLFFNPGSISRPRTGGPPTFGILHISPGGRVLGSVREYRGKGDFCML